MSNPEDQERLIRSLQRRDEAAFARMVREYQDRVFALVFRMLGDRAEAEDVSQEVFVTVFKSIDSFRGESLFSTWLFRIAHNRLIDHYRSQGRDIVELYDDPEDDPAEALPAPAQDMPAAMLERRQTAQRILDALAELPEAQREVFLLTEAMLVKILLQNRTLKTRHHQIKNHI
jgi:RNA polymerase sigma-70 factor (ECF subfamily)